jgi:hypothetical protein
MKASEKLRRLARLAAEWNYEREEERICRKARDMCYEFTKLHHRIFIKEWNKLLKEKKATK